MDSVTYQLSGLGCEHCVKSIEGAVGKLPGITEIKVDLDSQTARVSLDRDKTGDDYIRQTVEEEGYEFLGQKE